ncbi:hypothetical protein E0L36_00285 [Streptomyces sp. AJS327]|nr:hypothetical protein [Streptomyces sp. AJS327]
MDGLSPRTRYEIARLECARGYLRPGTTAVALRHWRAFVHDPYHRLWVDHDGGCGIWECCADPHEARELLEGVRGALRPRARREFGRLLAPLDARY